jgi:WD40 repeat protein
VRTESDDREEWIIRQARERPSGERAAFLDGACGGDRALRHRVEAGLAGGIAAEAATIKAESIDYKPDEAEGQSFGRYKLLEKLGEGGFGAVWLAEQKEPVRRKVALKIIKLGMDTKAVVARFEAERQALAMMDHPNIAKVLDAGATESGRPYFVMELVRGVRITEYCDQAQLSTRERLELFIKVCQAIQHAHQKGIIHRDIKPSNILVTLHDGVPVPKVIDFGIAKATRAELTEQTIHTQFQQFIGTPAYMSPEQAEMSGLDIDTRSDIYSLGVLLYELLVGSTPFDAQELVSQGIDAMRKTIREKEPVRPSTKLATLGEDNLTTNAKRRSTEGSKLIHQLKGDLDWIVMKCLEKDRTRRYETANGLAADLKRHLNNEAVVARPPSAAYRLQKAFYRNKLLFAAGSAVALALVVGLGLATAGLRRALKAQANEAVQRRAAEESQAREAELRQTAEIHELAARRRAYASDMNLAQQSLAANDFGRTQELLNRHRPATKSEVDLRGWEWRYLWQFCQGDDLFTLCRQRDSAFSLSVSGDGRWLAVGFFFPTAVSVWDLRTRQEIARPRVTGPEDQAHNRRVLFSPRGPLLAYTHRTKSGYTIELWNVATERSVGTLPLNSECFGLSFSEDGQRLATINGKPGSSITLWSIPDGRKLRTIPLEREDFGQSLLKISASRDLSTVAYAMINGRIGLISLATGQELWSAKAANEWTLSLTFSPDGKTLASSAGYIEGAIKLWDVASGKQLSVLEGHQSWVSSVVFWPDGKKLASASADQTIQLWDVEHPAQPHRMATLRGQNAEIWSLALLPDNVTLISGGKDGAVRAWDSTKEQRNETAVTFPERLLHWHFAADGHSIVTLDAEGQVSRWKGDNFQEREVLTQIDHSAPNNPDFFCLARSGRFVAKGTTNGTVRVWEVERGTVRELSTKPGMTRPLAFLAQGGALIFEHGDNSISQWDFASGKETDLWQPRNRVRSRAFSPDEHWFVAIGLDGTSILRNQSTLTQTNFGLNLEQSNDASFSPDGKTVAAISWTGIGKVWAVEPARELGTLRGFRLGIDSVAFSPDGSRIAAGGSGKEALKLYDTASFQELLTVEAEGSNYYNTEFSPDGNVLASMSGRGVARLWRAPSWDEISRAEKKKGGENKQP